MFLLVNNEDRESSNNNVIQKCFLFAIKFNRMTNKCFWDCDTDGQVFETIVTVNYDYNELINSEIN